jgi:hypothetical protein
MYVENILPRPQAGLGWWWSPAWFTIWDGSKWLPARNISSSAATEWRLNEMEKNWGKSVAMYRYDNVSKWKVV